MLHHQEAVGDDGQTGVMMETAPAAPFIVTEPEILLEVLVVALDVSAHLCFQHHAFQRHVLRQGRQPLPHRLLVAFGPFDERPPLGSKFGAPIIAMRGMHRNSPTPPVVDCSLAGV